jgi:CSLREA domain-containing protein
MAIKWRAVVVALVAVVCGSPAAAGAATITVTSTQDDSTPNNGTVTLRKAITAINAGTDVSEPDIQGATTGTFGVNDTILFNIAGSGPSTIDIGSSSDSAHGMALPSLTNPVLINTTSPQQVILDGTDAGANPTGLTLLGGSSTINGLSFEHFSGAGIDLTSSNNLITGNFIGTDFTGTTAAGNGNGIIVASGSGNTIGGTSASARNLISGNTLNGILISTTAGASTVDGNFIGTTLPGTGPLPNAGNGVLISGGSSNNYIGGVIVGAGNVISANTLNGVLVTDSGTSSNLIGGNFIGTDDSGSTPLFNGSGAVDLTAAAAGNTFINNTIGSGTFPINMNGLANHDADNSFLTPPGVQNFVIGAINPATLALGSPVASASNINVPYTVTNAIGGDSLFTTLYRAQCGTWSVSNPVSDSSVMFSGGGGPGTFTFPAPLPAGVLFAGADGNTSATNLLNPCFPSTVINTGPPSSGTPEQFIFDPTTNTFVSRVGLSANGMSFTQGNPNSFQTNFVITVTIVGFQGARGSSRAVLSKKHKGKKKAKSFPLKSVSITLASGKHQLVKVALTGKAKAYLKHEIGKSVVVKLVTEENDGAGHSKTFQRTLNVKVLKAKKTKAKAKKH